MGAGLVTVYEPAGGAAVNDDILTVFSACCDDAVGGRSHFFNGRYENIYLPLERVPAVRMVLDHALARAAAMHGRRQRDLRAGFWFNAMQPGDRTLAHSHDEEDELVSGAWYVAVPPGSGDFLIRDGARVQRVTPRAGMLLLFDPALEHEVDEHRGTGLRLSIGINIGPAR